MVGGLWHSSAARAPPDAEILLHDPDAASDEAREVTFVDIDTFSHHVFILTDTCRPGSGACAPRDSPRCLGVA